MTVDEKLDRALLELAELRTSQALTHQRIAAGSLPVDPAGAPAPGEAGTIFTDSDYIYVCVAISTW